ncbi:hypothetical protein NDU88_004971 [Pleurodeles waltl]|uniref:Uncharacterized protein n=1 Tax=Pleurodeles waltl TaxID=8319 RepID=A0AAV7WAG4_PLEWA|nr:hypothetical protein NDU88_004971 [Pleurodeles waltl]
MLSAPRNRGDLRSTESFVLLHRLVRESGCDLIQPDYFAVHGENLQDGVALNLNLGISCALVHIASRHQGESPQYGDFCAASLSRSSSPLLTISFAFLAPAPFRRTKESGHTGKGPSDPLRLSQAVVAKGRLSLEPQERSRRYRPLSSPIRFSLRARDAALRTPAVPIWSLPQYWTSLFVAMSPQKYPLVHPSFSDSRGDTLEGSKNLPLLGPPSPKTPFKSRPPSSFFLSLPRGTPSGANSAPKFSFFRGRTPPNESPDPPDPSDSPWGVQGVHLLSDWTGVGITGRSLTERLPLPLASGHAPQTSLSIDVDSKLVTSTQ